MIDWRGVEALQAVAEHGTVTAAAVALGYTPSAVSQQIASLGRALGTDMLERTGRRVRLTPAARELLSSAAGIDAAWQETTARIASMDPTHGTLRICGVSSAIAALAAPAMSALLASHPGLSVTVRETESADSFALLAADEADIALILPTPQSPPESDTRYTQRVLLNDPQDLLVPADHPLARQTTPMLRAARHENWIVKRQDNDTFALLTVACAAAGFTPTVVHEVKEWFAVSALVHEGLGVCLLPRMVPIPAEHRVRRVALSGDARPTRRVLLAVRRGSERHPAIAAGIAALEAVAGSVRS